MKAVLAFGDSNTWGLIPGSKSKERFPRGTRWTSLLQKHYPKIDVIEEGLFEDELRPGRRGVAALPMILETHHPLDAAVVMLGTNDCKTVYGASAYAIGQGLDACLKEIEPYISPANILVVSPILLGEDVWKPVSSGDVFCPRSAKAGVVAKELSGQKWQT